MAPAAVSPRRGTGSRQASYFIGAVINGLLLYLINGRPGWQALGFLTEETPDVLGLVNLSLAVGLVAYLVYVVHDPPWLKTLGDLVSVTIALAVLVRVWQVFPFEFTGSFDWAKVFRVVLVLAMIGTGAGLIATTVQLVRITSRAHAQ
jgi:hypothetical protein